MTEDFVDVSKEIAIYAAEHNFTYFRNADLNTMIPVKLTDTSLELARVYLLSKDHNIRISQDMPVNMLTGMIFYRELELSEKQIDSINLQLELIRDLIKISIPALTKRPGKWYVSFHKTEQYDTTFSELSTTMSLELATETARTICGHPTNNAVDSIFLGIETLYFLEHQNTTRYRALMKDPKAAKSNAMFNDFFKNHNSYPENSLIISGSTLHAYGTTYTSDIDMFIINADRPKMPEQVEYYSFQDGQLVHPADISAGRVEYWTKTWPNTFGAENLETVLHDPRFHFTFLGAKFMSIKGTIQRLISRAAPAAYVDLIMLKKMNNIDPGPLCVPSSSLRKGTLKIYDTMSLRRLYQTMSKFFREWHGINMSEHDLSKMIKRCPDRDYCDLAVDRTNVHGSTFADLISERDKVVCKMIDAELDKGSGQILVLNVSDNVKDHFKQNPMITFEPKKDEYYNLVLIDLTFCDTVAAFAGLQCKTIKIIWPNAAKIKDNISYEVRKDDDPVFGLYYCYQFYKGSPESLFMYVQGDPVNDRGHFRKILTADSLQKELIKKYGRKYREMNTYDFSEDLSDPLSGFSVTDFEDIMIDPVSGGFEGTADSLEEAISGSDDTNKKEMQMSTILVPLVTFAVIFVVITIVLYYIIQTKLSTYVTNISAISDKENYSNRRADNLRFRV